MKLAKLNLAVKGLTYSLTIWMSKCPPAEGRRPEESVGMHAPILRSFTLNRYEKFGFLCVQREEEELSEEDSVLNIKCRHSKKKNCLAAQNKQYFSATSGAHISILQVAS